MTVLTSRDISNFLVQIQLLSFTRVCCTRDYVTIVSKDVFCCKAFNNLLMLNFATYLFKIIVSPRMQRCQLNMSGL